MYGSRNSQKTHNRNKVDSKLSGAKSNPFDSDDELDSKVSSKPSTRTPETKFVVPKANPFDSDDELDSKVVTKPLRRTPETKSGTSVANSNPFDHVDQETPAPAISSSKYSVTSSAPNKYKSGFVDSVDFENQSVQELEDYAVHKAEETTATINGCLKIAEEMRESGTQTLSALHQQGEQITKSHHTIVNIDNDLSRGEKFLGSLGGIFSRTWKPKKNQQISGPVITRDVAPKVSENHIEQKAKLRLNNPPKDRSTARAIAPEPTNAMEKIEMEKAKQDDALTDLSNMLGEMKMMAIDMGTEIDWQTKAIDHYEDEVVEMNSRLRGANARGLRLLRK